MPPKTQIKISNKNVIFALSILGILYFCAFILPNLVGTKNIEMVGIFEVDEYAQFPFLAPMLQGGSTLKLALRNFLVYGHYFYGYPFYLFSSLSMLPLRVVLGVDWYLNTQVSILVLRLVINVLPGILGAFALTFFTTQFKSIYKSVLLFLLILFTPALVRNGFWWHPDGLGLMFVAFVYASLRADDLRFGKWFILAAVFTGIAAGIKYLGFFFFMGIPIYVFFGFRQKLLSWQRALMKCTLFLFVMLLVFVITNPLLLLPLERAELIATQSRQFLRSSEGELIGRQPFLENGMLPTWLTQNYGSIPYLLLVMYAMMMGFIQAKNRPYASLIISFIIPFAIIILRNSLQRSHYWLPIFLPISATLAYLLPDELPTNISIKNDYSFLVVAGIIVLQMGLFTLKDVSYFNEMMLREENSPSLQFYAKAKEILRLAHTQPSSISLYRDWKVYFPSDEKINAFMDWNLASYDLVQAKKPDFVLLEQVNVMTYGAADFLAKSADPHRLAPMHQFYADALLDEIHNYKLIYQDSFGLIFERES